MIQKVLQDKFIKDNIIFFIGSMGVAILNYLYHPVMSRMMSVEDFGEVQALISLTYLTGIFGVIFGTIATNIISNHDNTASRVLVAQLHKIAFYVIGFFALGILVLSPYLRDALQFHSAISFVPLIFILLASVPMIFYNGYFCGTKKFGVASVTGLINSGGKLLFAVVLVFFGLRVFGAVSALATAALCALIYMMYMSKGKFQINWREKLVWSPALREELSYGVLIFFSLGYITFLYTSDVLLVKYFFSPETAGLYSGIATIARIIFFATASVAGVLLPTIQMKASYKKNFATLKKAFIVIMLMGAGALGVFYFFSEMIIVLLIGEKYLPLAHLLPLVGLYIFLASVTNVVYSYSLALRDRRLIGVSLSGVGVIIILTIWQHNSLEAIVMNYTIGAVVTIAIAGVTFLCTKRKMIK